jgi:hypothetical protein
VVHRFDQPIESVSARFYQNAGSVLERCPEWLDLTRHLAIDLPNRITDDSMNPSFLRDLVITR